MASDRFTDLDLNGWPLRERRRVSKFVAAIQNAQSQLEQVKDGDEDSQMAKYNVILGFAEELEAAKFFRKGRISRIPARSMSPSRSAHLKVHLIRFRVVAGLYLTQNISLSTAQSVVADVERVSLDAVKASCRRVIRGDGIVFFDRAANRVQTDPDLNALIKAFKSELARRQGR